VVHATEEGWDEKKIAKHYRIDPRTVRSTLDKYEETGSVEDRPRSGRKRVLDDRDTKTVLKKAKKRKTAPQIARTLKKKVSTRTVQRTIKNSGLKWLRIRKVDKLKPVNEAKRLEYAKEKKKYNWKKVLFSDEKSFWLGSIPTHAWQDPNHRITVEVPKYAPKLHVWAAIGYYVKTKLYFSEQNLDGPLYQQILKARLKEKDIIYSPDCPRTLRKKWLFLQDNDPKHKAKKSMAELENLIGDRLLLHPAYSPDLNPIEDMWSYLDLKLKNSNVQTIPSLQRFLNKEWNALPWTEIRKSVNSMPKRLKECIKLNGKRTHY
jgi:transposase